MSCRSHSRLESKRAPLLKRRTRLPRKGILLVLPSFALALSNAVEAQNRPRESGIRGAVVDETSDLGIADVFIELLDASSRVRGSATTDRDGGFVLSDVPVSRFQLRASRLGYRTATTPYWWAEPGEALTVIVRLHPDAVLLAPLEITATSRSQSPVLSSFYHRLDHHVGGIFLTREDIERRNPGFVTDLLATVPGVHLESSGRGADRIVTIGRASDCPAQIYIDGRLMSRGEAVSIDDIVSPSSVEGIEVYRGLSTVPAEFLSRESICGVVALWTRRGR